MSYAKHTPLPWRSATRQGSWDWIICQNSDSNIEVCQMFHDGTELNEVGEANVELILTAVNSHAALMAENATLKERLVKAGAVFKQIEELGEKADPSSALTIAIRAGNLSHAARIELGLTDDVSEGGR